VFEFECCFEYENEAVFSYWKVSKAISLLLTFAFFFMTAAATQQNEQQGRQAKTLEDGIPPLLQQISLSPPSVPKQEDHAAVEHIERDFGVMPLVDFQKIFQNRSRCWDDVKADGKVRYASENDVAALVSGLVKDIGQAMELDLDTFTEVGAFGLRPESGW
jgi:hypothetical protein